MDHAIIDTINQLVEEVESYNQDFNEHIDIFRDFIVYYKNHFDAEILLDTIVCSLDYVRNGESFFDEFDLNGLGGSLTTILANEIKIYKSVIKEAETESEKIEAQKHLSRLETQAAEWSKMSANPSGFERYRKRNIDLSKKDSTI